jgi:voltage-gated potassium channel
MTRKRFDHLSPAQRRRRLTLELLRMVLAAAPPVVLYYLAPLDGPLDISTLIGFALGLVVFVVVIIWQVRAIASSDVPRLRALQGTAVAVSTLLVVFAATYVVISNGEPGSFSEPLGRTDALYFTLTLFTTVGLGDIAPRSEVARIIAMMQMVIGLITVGLVARIVLGAAEIAVSRREDEHATETDDRAGGG